MKTPLEVPEIPEVQLWKDIVNSTDQFKLAKARWLLLNNYPPFKKWLEEEERRAKIFYEAENGLESTAEIHNRILDAMYERASWNRSHPWKVKVAPKRNFMGKLKFFGDRIALEYGVTTSSGVTDIDKESLTEASKIDNLKVDNPYSIILEIDIRSEWTDISAEVRARWKEGRNYFGIKNSQGKKKPIAIQKEDFNIFLFWLTGVPAGRNQEAQITKLYNQFGIKKPFNNLRDDYRKRIKALRSFVDPNEVAKEWSPSAEQK